MPIIHYSAVILIPALAFIGVAYGELSTWGVPIVIFGIIPIAEHWFEGSKSNVPPESESSRASDKLGQFLLLSLLPIQVLCVVGLILRADTFSAWELVGLTIGVGTVQGALGINGAHELGHHLNPTSRRFAQCMLVVAMYPHFLAEHNKGHHTRVATPDDPATATRGQSVYSFWLQSLGGGFLSAWRFETERLLRANHSIWSLKNNVLRNLGSFLLIVVGAAFVGGWRAVIAYVLASIIGVLLLETVNYLQHYGLLRNRREDGNFERVGPNHSWVSNRPLSRVLLFDLPRHADHHIHAGRHFSNLRHLEGSPELPTGYPGLILIALIPPLFKAMMHSQLRSFENAPK